MSSASKSNATWPQYAVVLAVALLVIVAGLGSFGFWEGAELHMAGIARGDMTHEIAARPSLQTTLPRIGFGIFGGTETGGRLPVALYALIATMMVAVAVGRVADARAGMWAGAVYATMPLVFMNARQLFGGGVAQSSFTIGLSGAAIALWGRPPNGRESMWANARWLLVALIFLSVPGAGVLLGLVPLALGLGITLLLRWRDEPQSNRIGGVVLAVSGAALAIAGGLAATKPLEGYNMLVGAAGDMRGPALLPTFDTFIEHVGHGLFPWTGVAAFAMVRLLVPPPMKGSPLIGANGEGVDDANAWRESGLKIAAFVAMVLAFGLQSFHVQLFGMSPFIAVAPIAIATGLALRDAEREAQPWRIIASGATFFTVIMMRDFLLFPKSSYSALGLPDGGPTFPTGATSTLREALHHGGFFGARAMAEEYFVIEALLFILIALCALYQGGGGTTGAGAITPFAWDRPFTWVGDVERAARRQLRSESKGPTPWWKSIGILPILGHLRVVLTVLTIAMIGVFGALAAFVPMVTPAHIACEVVALIPIVTFFAIYGFVILWNGFAYLGSPKSPTGEWLGSRIALVPIGGLVVALIIAHLYVPALSRHLSPRDVWLATASARHGDEPVARFGGPANDPAPRFYTHFDVNALQSEQQAVDWLNNRSPRHLLVVNTGADVFPPLNRSYRRSAPEGSRENIPVLDATNSNLFLAVSDLGDTPSQNPLDRIVMTHDSLTGEGDNYHLHGRYDGDRLIPEPARLDDAIEYVGYNIDAGGGRYVPVGSTVTITYHYHVLREVPGNHQIFVHVDGQCPRVNGDHDPAEGKYPVRYWLPGDFVHDVHRFTIPGYCRPGRYQVFVGFFQGDNRMRITGGDHDRENRIVAATLDVR